MVFNIYKEKEIMPVDKVRGGYKVRSYVTGKQLKRLYKTRKAAENAAATSRRRSQRKRSKNSRRARNSRRMY
tara:strand:- start:1703 stop:1918 length:216 start_codon:yes stop_codon:yes gene_type:complete